MAIVTGGARGLGRAYALALARDGFGVVVADIRSGDDTVAEIVDAGGSAIAVQADVSDDTSTEAMARETMAHFGRIDVLINNAGYFSEIYKKPFEQIAVDEWDRAFAVNVRGTWLATKAVVPAMRAQRYGKVINTSSMTV
ncbi:MAG: SDR family NAD(P)-dependent oxidoreductase, partial [Gaiellales bacterium]